MSELSCQYCLDFLCKSIYQLIVSRISIAVAHVELDFMNLTISSLTVPTNSTIFSVWYGKPVNRQNNAANLS